MNPAFLGKWNLETSKSSGVKEFAKAIGYPEEQMKMYDKMDLTVTISKEGDGYKFHVDFKGAAPAISYVVTVGKPVNVPVADGSNAQVSEFGGVKMTHFLTKA
ncbi:hypothetical protein ElyMa_002252200 [Elysia marginata]|uniref:Lipocalin/cytosolic fatty-acid binding domain-containing protein n=1 Tax=Elysia marginata TaxID=1093978 RepID=A0AAV4FXR1_9GAST|nr:hypothetical protein ElyMa_002252200 [Elysia marginata]